MSSIEGLTFYLSYIIFRYCKLLKSQHSSDKAQCDIIYRRINVKSPLHNLQILQTSKTIASDQTDPNSSGFFYFIIDLEHTRNLNFFKSKRTFIALKNMEISPKLHSPMLLNRFAEEIVVLVSKKKFTKCEFQ